MQVEAVSRATGAAPQLRRARVLLVEDNARLAASIREYLENHNI